jgi:hypothetical protein
MYIINGQTLKPGGTAITIDGTVLSLPAHATAPVTIVDPVYVSGLGNLIWKGFGGKASSTTSSKNIIEPTSPGAEASRTGTLQASPTSGEMGSAGGRGLLGAAVGLFLTLLTMMVL